MQRPQKQTTSYPNAEKIKTGVKPQEKVEMAVGKTILNSITTNRKETK